MIQYKPTFRCLSCRKIKIRDGIRTWIFQPPMPTNGRGDSPGKLFFICRTCKKRRKNRKDQKI